MDTAPTHHRRGLSLAAAAGLALGIMLSLSLAGCDSNEPGEGTSSTAPAQTGTTVPENLGMFAPPGLYELEGGRTQAFGVLMRRDLEGGFWAVVEALPGDETETTNIVAVLIGADDLDVDVASLEGKLVTAEGTISGGASIFMAGPELLVETLQEASDMTVVPQSQ